MGYGGESSASRLFLMRVADDINSCHAYCHIRKSRTGFNHNCDHTATHGVRTNACPHKLSVMNDLPVQPEPPKNEPSQGTIPPLATPDQRNEALDQAFDYRGDITIHTADGRTIEGYVFDRRSHVAQPYVRLVPSNSQERVQIPYAQITGLVFSGRDTAAGKSWETWVKKYHDKRAKGESASMEPESLD